MNELSTETLKNLIKRYPDLADIKTSFLKSAELILQCFKNDGRMYVCGNGGSSADADHIAGELIKGFLQKRPMNQEKKLYLLASTAGYELFTDKLQEGLPAYSLCSNSALLSAICNDQGPELIFAQQIFAMAKPGDCLLCLSTSGTSPSIVFAAKLAKAMGLCVISLTGPNLNDLDEYSTITLHCPGNNTGEIQDMHRPVYHALCEVIEKNLFD